MSVLELSVCLRVKVSVAVIKHMTKDSLERRGFVSSDTSRSQESLREVGGQELTQRLERSSACWLAPHDLLSLFIIHSGAPAQGLLYRQWMGPPTWVTNPESAPQASLQASNRSIFSPEAPLPDNSSVCQINNKKTNQDCVYLKITEIKLLPESWISLKSEADAKIWMM